MRLWAAHLSSRSEEEQEPGGMRIGVPTAEERPEGDCGHAECRNRGIRHSRSRPVGSARKSIRPRLLRTTRSRPYRRRTRARFAGSSERPATRYVRELPTPPPG